MAKHKGFDKMEGFDIEWRMTPSHTVQASRTTRLKPEYDRPENYMTVENEFGGLIYVIKSGLPAEWLETVIETFPGWVAECRVTGYSKDWCAVACLDANDEAEAIKAVREFVKQTVQKALEKLETDGNG